MRVLRPRFHVTAWLSLALVVVLSATGARAVEGEDPPDPLPAPAEPTPVDTAPTTPAPTEPAASDTSATESESGESAAVPATDAPPSTTEPTTEGEDPTLAPTAPSSDAPSAAGPVKRRRLDAPPAAEPAPLAPPPEKPVEVQSGADVSVTTTPWFNASGWVVLGVIAGMVPVALGVATLALGVLGFAWTAATPIGAANAAIPFALVGCGLIGGVGLAGPIGSAVVAAVMAGSAWSAYDTETALDVLFGGAPGFFLAGLSLAGLPVSCLFGGLAMVYLGAIFANASALIVALGLALVSAGIGGAAMGSACMAPVVTGVGAFSTRRAIDNEKERRREEVRQERKRSNRAMAY